MRVFNLLLLISMFIPFPLPAQVGERYIEVTGTSEIEVVPDRIHYVIEIREYFEEEFDGVSKPEEYRTKVPLTRAIGKRPGEIIRIVEGEDAGKEMFAQGHILSVAPPPFERSRTIKKGCSMLVRFGVMDRRTVFNKSRSGFAREDNGHPYAQERESGL